jgi:hypothetical protein
MHGTNIKLNGFINLNGEYYSVIDYKDNRRSVLY